MISPTTPKQLAPTGGTKSTSLVLDTVELYNAIFHGNHGPVIPREADRAEAHVYKSVKAALDDLSHKIFGIPKNKLDSPVEWLLGMLQFDTFRPSPANSSSANSKSKGGRHALNSHLFRQVIGEAVKTGDLEFFKRLGLVLAVEPRDYSAALASQRVQMFVIASWISYRRDRIGFCHLSNDQIIDRLKAAGIVAKSVSGNEWIYKMIQRMGLKKGKLYRRGMLSWPA